MSKELLYNIQSLPFFYKRDFVQINVFEYLKICLLKKAILDSRTREMAHVNRALPVVQISQKR